MRRSGLKLIVFILFCGLCVPGIVTLNSLTAAAVEPGEVLQDPALEARARALSAGLRCVVCQNQSIDDSDAPLAQDLRRLVRERLVAGDSDREVEDYIVARYGKFVLLNPPLGSDTLLLWFLPLFIVLAAFYGVYRGLFKPRTPDTANDPPVTKLTDDEHERLKGLLRSQNKDHT